MDDVVRRAPLFTALDDEAAAALRATMVQVQIGKGQVLFNEGDAGDRLYVVVEGKIKLGIKSGDGRENLLGVLGPGEMFGELSLFDPLPRTATATALILEEERMFDMKRRIKMIHSFSGLNGRAAMIRSLCREIAFNTAHSIALWQKNSDETTTADMYHPSWANFDDDSEDDEQGGSGSESDD